jgi:glycosyltransferase involved in cell wall biosynthesis
MTRARLVPACKKALRLDADCIDPLAHHMLMLERIFSEAEDFDLIHFHIDYLHFPMSRRSQVPTVTTLHGRLDLPDLVPLYKEFSEMPLVSISDAQRKPLAWANWLGTVHHGMPPKSLPFNPDGGEYLAFLGRISPEKGLDRAIEIASRAGMKLKVAAKIDRADQRYFERTIEPLLNNPLIEFVGEVGNSEKGEFLGNATALLFPIDWPEPFGLVMIEALACGTPVIAFPHGSVPEIILDGVAGFLVNDIDEAVEAVNRIDAIDRRDCRRHFERNFTDKRMTCNYLDIYQQLVNPDLVNPDSANPDLVSQELMSSDLVSRNLVSPDLVNPDLVRAAPQSALQKGVLKWIEVESSTPSTT